MAKSEFPSSPKRQFLFNPLKRPMPYIGLILGVLIIIFQGTIRQYTANLVGGWLISNLKTSTQGNYTLDYDFVRFDIFTKELRIKDLNLSLDTAVIKKEQYLEQYNNLLDISTPVAVLKLESLWELIVNDRLKVAYIGMQEPRFNLIRSEALSEEKSLKNAEQTNRLIRNYLNEIEIDSIRILNGSVNVDLRNAAREEIIGFRVRNFSTLLRGFQLNEINSSRLFQGIYVDDVEIEILDQEILLPKFHHKLNFERLWVSSKDSIIQLDTIQISPFNPTNKSLEGTMKINQIALKSIDFRKAYDEFIMDIGAFHINKLDLKIVQKLFEEVTTNQAQRINLSMLPFHTYLVRDFRITESKVDLGIKRKFKAENLNIKLLNYQFDTTNVTIDKLTDGIREFSIGAKNIAVDLPDSIHQAQVQSVYLDSKSSFAKFDQINIYPITERRKYALYKQQGANLITYATIKTVAMAGVNYDEMITNQQFLIDSIQLNSPSANITQYPYIKSIGSSNKAPTYLINQVKISNGSINFNKRENSRDNRTEATGIDLKITSLYPESPNKPTFDNLDLNIDNGSTHLASLNHTLNFKNLHSLDLRRFDLDEFNLSSDSTNISGNKYELSSQGLSLIAYNRDFITNNKRIELEELSAQALTLNVEIKENQPKRRKSNDLERVILNRFYFNRGNIHYRDSLHNFDFKNVSTFLDSLDYNFNDTISSVPLNFKDFTLAHSEFKVKSNSIELSGKSGKYSERDSVLSFSNVDYKISSGLDGSFGKIQLNGLKRHELFENKFLSFEHLILSDHQLTLHVDSTETSTTSGTITNTRIKELILAEYRKVNIDSVTYRNGQLALKNNDRSTYFNNVNINLRDYYLDSSTVRTKVLSPGLLNLNVSQIQSESPNDTITISGASINLTKNTIFTGNIEGKYYNETTRIAFDVPGLIANGFSLNKIIRKDFSIDSLLLRNANIDLLSTDSVPDNISISKNKNDISERLGSIFSKKTDLNYDTLFKPIASQLILNEVQLDSNKNINFKKILSKLKIGAEQPKEAPLDVVEEDSMVTVTVISKAIQTNGIVRHIGLENSLFRYSNPNFKKHFLNELKFSVELDSVILDSINSFNVYNHIQDFSIKINNYAAIFPDSLNRLTIDEVNYSSNSERLDIQGLSLTPMVNKYDYDNRKGYQAGWHHLENINVKIEELDLFKLINQKIAHIRSISTSAGTLNIFKDKELPIPINQYHPMFQESIRKIPFPIVVDSINIKGFHVNFASRLNVDLPEGELNFHQLNASAVHLSNIDSLLFDHPNLVFDASTLIMGKGLLVANFNFNMVDEENTFNFTAHLNPMSAREFNSLLEATAYVSVESGNIKDIKLKASGDKHYAIGKMTFQYNDLKVSTINKKNLKTTGMGKVILTFFANAFVVKKNNPAIKFFPREGDMYFERDQQKIIIDYLAKTALSGVVSSIGARNVRKDIKRIQNESKKEKDAQLKALKKENKASAMP